MRKIIAAVGLVLSLAACGVEPAPTEGTITRLPYGGESFWYSSTCGQWKNVDKTRQVPVRDSKGKITGYRPERYTDRKCVQNLQVAHRKEPWWQVCIGVPSRDDHCVNVSESTWRSLTVGTFYRIGTNGS